MKAVLVQPYGQTGGHQSGSTLRLTRALVEAGVEVSLVSRNGFRDGWERNLPVEHTAVALLPDVAATARRLRHRKLVNHYELWRIFDHALARAEADPDSVVHVLDFEAVTLSLARMRRRRAACVLTLGSADFTFATAHGGWSKRAFAGCGGSLLGAATATMAVVCHSERIAELAAERGLLGPGVRPSIIPSGIDAGARTGIPRDAARRQLGIPAGRRVVVSFGPVRPVKGVDLLLDGLSRIERGRVTTIIAGTLEHSGEFDPVQYARSKGCEDDVVFISKYVSREEMDVIFGAADAVVLPYRSYFQGQSDVLLTACEYGLPVLASEVGDLGAKARSHGLGVLFAPDSADAVAGALGTLAAMPSTELAAYRPRLRAYAESRPWSNVAQELDELYRRTREARFAKERALPAAVAPGASA